MRDQKSFFPSRSEVSKVKSSSNRGSVRTGLNSGRGNSGDWWAAAGGDKAKSSNEKVYDCTVCGLKDKCHTPRIKRFGEGKKRILIVGDCPGRDEDKSGRLLIGKEATFLRNRLKILGINLEEDCVYTNAVACYKEDKPTKDQVKACSKYLQRDIEAVQPEAIICLGDIALQAVLAKPKACKFNGSLTVDMLHGLVIPDLKTKAWIGSTFHPRFYLGRIDNSRTPDDQNLMLFDLASVLGYLGRSLPKPLGEDGNVLLGTVGEAISAIEEIVSIEDPVAYDYETTTLTPWKKKAKVVSISFTNKVEGAYFIPLNFMNPRTFQPFFNSSEVACIEEAWKRFLSSKTPKIVQNIGMECTWDTVYFENPPVNVIHDSMYGSHVLYNRNNINGLAFQVFHMVGHDYKDMVNVKDIMSSRLEDLFHYNCYDSRYTLMAYYYQKPRIVAEGHLEEFNTFILEGAQALNKLTCRGVPIDVDMLLKMQKSYELEMDRRTKDMQNCPGVIEYKELKGVEFNPESSPQFAAVLKHAYKLVPTVENQLPVTGNKKKLTLCTDKNALPEIAAKVDNIEVKNLIAALLRFRKCGSFIKRAKNYWANMDSNNRVHPSYYILTNTYRSSAEDPNIQNVFKHDEELVKFRRCIVASLGNLLLEVDYSGMEVRVIAMASGDEELIRQINAGMDPHTRWASEIFQKPESEVTKQERYEAKNGFVFKSFYGGAPENMRGYSELFGTVTKEHFIKVQKKFWSEYKGVRAWQQRMIRTYNDFGYTEACSGFRRPGPLNFNKIYNTPIQGPGFHMLLKSLIKLDFENRLKVAGFKSMPLFEVHDSIAFDAVPQEIPELVKFVTDIMTKDVVDWQNDVPIAVDWDLGYNWYDMYKLKVEKEGLFVHKDKDTIIPLREFIGVAA